MLSCFFTFSPDIQFIETRIIYNSLKIHILQSSLLALLLRINNVITNDQPDSSNALTQFATNKQL